MDKWTTDILLHSYCSGLQYEARSVCTQRNQPDEGRYGLHGGEIDRRCTVVADVECTRAFTLRRRIVLCKYEVLF